MKATRRRNRFTKTLDFFENWCIINVVLFKNRLLILSGIF